MTNLLRSLSLGITLTAVTIAATGCSIPKPSMPKMPSMPKIPFVGDDSDGPRDRDRGSASNNTAVFKFEINGSERPVVIELFPDDAPKHVANFKEKILSGYYEGMAVHRAIPKFIVQAGDPLTRDDTNRDQWGTGGNTGTLAAEISRKHDTGAVSMARLTGENPGKRSSDSQFFITLSKRPELDGGYTVFGSVTQGLDVLESVAAQLTDTNDAPVNRINIVATSLVSTDAEINDPGGRRGVGGRIDTTPASQKGAVTRFIERVW